MRRSGVIVVLSACAPAVAAAVGSACAVTEKRTFNSSPELDWSSGTFGVDGLSVYVAGRDTGGVVSAPIE